MNLVRSTAAGRVVQAGPRLLLLSPPTLRGFGVLAAFVADRIPRPEDAPVGWLPDVSGDDAFAAYKTPLGAAVILWVTARRDHPDLGLDEALALTAVMDDAAIAVMVEAAFVRERHPRRSTVATGDRAAARGIHQVDFGNLFGSSLLAKFPPAVLADQTIDQIDCILADGRAQPDDAISFEEVEEMYRKATGRSL